MALWGTRVWGCKRVQVHMQERCFNIPTASVCEKKIKMDLVIAVKVQQSPPLISVLTTWSTLTDWTKYTLWAPTTFPKFWGKMTKATTQVTLYEPPWRDADNLYTSLCCIINCLGRIFKSKDTNKRKVTSASEEIRENNLPHQVQQKAVFGFSEVTQVPKLWMT